MWPLSAQAQAALATSRAMTVRATAYTARLGVVRVPVSGGAVTADATSQVRRTGSLTVSPRFWPADPFGVLSPWGAEMFVEYGIVLSSRAVEWVPLLHGVITEVSRAAPADGDAGVSVSVADLSQRVADDRLTAPRQTIAGSAVAAIRGLITETLPTATVVDETTGPTAASLDIEKERWGDGVEAIANAVGAEVFCDPTGRFVVRPQPTVSDSPVWRIRSGDRGILLSYDEKRTREEVANRIVVQGQRSDGTASVLATVDDTDPTSPTYYGGPFGRKPRFYTSPVITTAAQAQRAGASLLARTKGLRAGASLTALVNPALDTGDVVSVEHNGRTEYHIVDSVTVPLTASDAQQIGTRTDKLPVEQ